MANNGQAHLDKLSEAVKEGNPLKMAVLTYHAFRESPLADKLKVLDRKSYDETALSSITSMADILKRLGWEIDDIEKFSEHCKELYGPTE